MINPQSGERVIVHIHQELGPYVCVPRDIDEKLFEDVLEEKVFTLYLKENKKELITKGNIYYFGSIADPEKVQAFIDGITLGS